jgi:hypothetical protein
MELEQQIGMAILYVLGSCTVFYSLGYNRGKKDGYLKGRIIGISIGKQIEQSR